MIYGTIFTFNLTICIEIIKFADMTIRNKDQVNKIKRGLFHKLKEENSFWSYDMSAVTLKNIGDDLLIALTMRYLDLEEIKSLFSIYSYRKIKDAWKRHLVPEGEYLYTINRFFAWYYFKAKNPDSYLKSLITRHQNKLIGR